MIFHADSGNVCHSGTHVGFALPVDKTRTRNGRGLRIKKLDTSVGVYARSVLPEEIHYDLQIAETAAVSPVNI